MAKRIAQRRLNERREEAKAADLWPSEYVNADRKKLYKPHSEDEAGFVYSDTPRWGLVKGGEGAGKSVSGIIKSLERLRRGMNGIMVSPDLPHFKKSLWSEFQRWCPRAVVIPEQRYRLNLTWTPHEAFILNFVNGTSLLCGGIEKPQSWEGPNVNFWHMDEGRHADAEALKVLDGRCRIPGPNGEPPQGWITTTPKKNWLYEYFGPSVENDKYLDFKQNSIVITLALELNRENLADGYIEQRRRSLTEAEARVRVDAEWEDDSDIEKFVNIIWWDNCHEPLPPLARGEPLVLSLDAAKGGETNIPDCFAVSGCTRHPTRKADVAIRYSGIWLPPPGGLLDFEPIEDEIRRLCKAFSVVEVAYDPYQLHDMAMRFRREGLAHFREFPQGVDRLKADKQLQDLIMARRITHDGNPLLRQHVDNANIKKAGNEGVRLVKRTPALKIDAAVATSMAASRILYYSLG